MRGENIKVQILTRLTSDSSIIDQIVASYDGRSTQKFS